MTTISTAELRAKMERQDDFVVVDTLSQMEYESQHLPGETPVTGGLVEVAEGGPRSPAPGRRAQARLRHRPGFRPRPGSAFRANRPNPASRVANKSENHYHY